MVIIVIETLNVSTPWAPTSVSVCPVMPVKAILHVEVCLLLFIF